jgi:hypothetical protein
MFVVSGLNTAFPLAFSVIVTIDESLLEGEDALIVAMAEGKKEPIALPLETNAAIDKMVIMSKDDTRIGLVLIIIHKKLLKAYSRIVNDSIKRVLVSTSLNPIECIFS